MKQWLKKIFGCGGAEEDASLPRRIKIRKQLRFGRCWILVNGIHVWDGTPGTQRYETDRRIGAIKATIERRAQMEGWDFIYE